MKNAGWKPALQKCEARKRDGLKARPYRRSRGMRYKGRKEHRLKSVPPKEKAPRNVGAHFSTGIAYQISAWLVKRQMQIFSGAIATLKIKDFPGLALVAAA
jgi:hypothetical protein